MKDVVVILGSQPPDLPPLNPDEVLELYDALLEDAVARLLDVDLDVRLYAGRSVEPVPSTDPRWSSFPAPDLSAPDALVRIVASAFASGYEHVCLLRSDAAYAPTEFVRHAFDQLTAPLSAAIGPDDAGGCYLLALNDLFPMLLQGSRMERDDSFTSLIENASVVARSVSVMPVLPKSAHDAAAFLETITAFGAAGSNPARIIAHLRARHNLV